ncbi:DUF3164 family protein [Sphingobium lignivorans]|uniref:Sulfate transporter n=1 Tax=Sphingobium lignivorans TaxID=2735886 RepID=A0ABR6NJF4_9SPHN|nr:DUF3164 family protein [Sphingobium lignivorans]MBB5987409.1 hypothetical protein [Sphingobium lignivorans]
MTDIGTGRREIDGQTYMIDGKGGLIPIGVIKAQEQLQDDLVRKIVGFAIPLSEQITRFREHCLEDVDGFVAMLDQEYGAKRGGRKGNLSFVSYDGLLKVDVQVGETVSFGPELQTAKELVDECLRDWTADAREQLRAVITRAFDVDAQGRINRYNLTYLLRMEIADERWQEAMRAIRDSMRVIGSKRYIRIYRRAANDGAWSSINLNMAGA